MISVFPFDVYDGLCVLIRPASEVSLLLLFTQFAALSVDPRSGITYYWKNRSLYKLVLLFLYFILQLTLYDGQHRTSFGVFVPDITLIVSCELSQPVRKTISIFHVCMVWIEKSVTRVTDRHHEACRVMPNSDPE